MTLSDLKSGVRTGVDSLDYEHRELVALMEELCECFDRLGASEKSEPLEDVSDRFGALYARTTAHFALEERLMRERKYPQFKAHKADHERLLDAIRDMMEAYQSGRCADCAVSLRGCLSNWFSGHMEKDADLQALRSAKPRH